jgi:hypothetical protein
MGKAENFPEIEFLSDHISPSARGVFFEKGLPLDFLGREYFDIICLRKGKQSSNESISRWAYSGAGRRCIQL